MCESGRLGHLKFMIRACSSETYVQVSHYNNDFICETSPPEILYRLTPFPFASLKPDHSRTVAERLPRCMNCRGFVNKYFSFTETGYRCCFCGSTNPMPDRNVIDGFRGPEFQYDVYDAFCMGGKGFIQREHFVRTDIFVISLALLRERPFLLDLILNMTVGQASNRQMALVILHGAVSAIRFRPRFGLMTFCDGVDGMTRYSALFAAPRGFSAFIEQAKESILGLNMIPCVNQHREGLNMVFGAASLFGSNVHLLFDDNCFHSFSQEKDLRSAAMNLMRSQAQVSLSVFIDSVLYNNPLLDLVSMTGGYLRFYPINSRETDVVMDLRELMRTFMYHDTMIYVKAPENGHIVEFAGKGMQVTNCEFLTGKVEVGSTFYFSVSSKGVSSQYIQFSILFTTEVSVRKIRIITLYLKSQPPRNLLSIGDSIAAIVSQRMLTETEESAKEKLAEFRKSFKDYGKDCFDKVDSLFGEMNCGELRKLCMTFRSGLYSNMAVGDRPSQQQLEI